MAATVLVPHRVLRLAVAVVLFHRGSYSSRRVPVAAERGHRRREVRDLPADGLPFYIILYLGGAFNNRYRGGDWRPFFFR